MDLAKIEGMVMDSAADAGWPENVVASLRVSMDEADLVVSSPHNTFDLEYGSEKSDPKSAIRRSQPDIEKLVSESFEEALLDKLEELIAGKRP